MITCCPLFNLLFKFIYVFVLFTVIITFNLDFYCGQYQERFLLDLHYFDKSLVKLPKTTKDNFAINLMFFVNSKAFNY